MAAVQMMCARIGKVTGQGLAGNFRQRFPSWLLRVFILALLAANTINIAADLAGMADAAEMLSGVDSSLVCNGLVIQTDFSLNGPRCFADSVARVGLCRVQMTD